MSDDSVCSNPSGDNANTTSNYHSLFLYNTLSSKRGQKHSTPYRNQRVENSDAEETRRTVSKKNYDVYNRIECALEIRIGSILWMSSH